MSDDVLTPAAQPDRDALIAMLSEADLGGETSEKDMGDVFWRIEGNYNREGGGPGSRFEGKELTVWQARWARMHLIPAVVDHLIRAGIVLGQPVSAPPVNPLLFFWLLAELEKRALPQRWVFSDEDYSARRMR